MVEKEITFFIAFICCVSLIVTVAIILFVRQYSKNKLFEQTEKRISYEQHRLDLVNSELMVQEQTMQLIGREIHDSVAQKLTLASIYSQKLEFENKYPEIVPNIRTISSIINASLVEIRELSKTLTNAKIRDVGLEDLLEFDCQQIENSGKCKLSLSSNFRKPLNITAKTVIYRVLQEFIQNSLRHSGCSLITIEIQQSEKNLTISAGDNGTGFDTKCGYQTGIGLANLERRAKSIGAEFRFHSEVGVGTNMQLLLMNEEINHE